SHGIEIRRTLELYSTDEPPGSARLKPFLHQRQQSFRIAHDIRKQPIDRPDLARIKRKSARAAICHAGKSAHVSIESSLVDAENAAAETLQNPCPAARACAQIDA